MCADTKARRSVPSAPADQAKKKKTWTRQRTGTPRSRSGCITCKIRHTKCDETRPFCLRCTKSGFQCDGYESSPDEKKKKKGPSPLELAITSYALPFRVPGSQEDRRMLHYFCVQAADDLAGFMNPEFWTKIVLQRSQDEQVVRQAVIALSSVHLENASAASENSSAQALGASEEIMVQYNRSLRGLRKYLNHSGANEQGSPSLVVILICCAIFYCFEGARGNSEAALQHLRMGLAILSDKANREAMSQRAQDLEDMFKLEDLFQRLDLQATLYDYTRTPLLDLVSSEEKMGIVSCIGAEPFRGLEEAYSALAKLQNWGLRLLVGSNEYKFHPLEKLPPLIIHEKRVLMAQLALWREKFEAFLVAADDVQMQKEAGSPGSMASSTDSISDLRSHPIALLALIHYSNMMLFLESSFPWVPGVFDAPLHLNPHRDKIEAILEHSETILRATQRADESGKARSPASESRKAARRRRIISAETGVVAPLLFLAFKSEKRVASRAQQLLELSDRKEGLYDAQVAAAVAKTLMEMSQANSPGPEGNGEGEGEGEDEDEDEDENGEFTTRRALEWDHIEILDPNVGIDLIAKQLGVT